MPSTSSSPSLRAGGRGPGSQTQALLSHDRDDPEDTRPLAHVLMMPIPTPAASAFFAGNASTSLRNIASSSSMGSNERRTAFSGYAKLDSVPDSKPKVSRRILLLSLLAVAVCLVLLGLSIRGLMPAGDESNYFDGLQEPKDKAGSDENLPILPDWPPAGGKADEEKKEFVRGMMRHAWNGYKIFAWGSDELRPVTRRAGNWSIINGTFLYTPVDALSTLLLMDLRPEYLEAKNLIVHTFHGHFGFNASASGYAIPASAPDMNVGVDNTDMNLFETTIRFMGGLLAAYELDTTSNDTALLDLARSWGTMALVTFNESARGVPLNTFNPVERTVRPDWGSADSVIIAQAGSIQLEFQYLSDVTGDPIFAKKAFTAYNKILRMHTQVPGLYPHTFSGETMKYTTEEITLGAYGDSFYEYLLKIHLASGNTTLKEKYEEAADALIKHVVVSNGTHAYIPKTTVTEDGVAYRDPYFEHLSCFAGGMYVLGASASSAPRTDLAQRRRFDIGKQIADACWASYDATETGIGAEKVDGYAYVPYAAIFHLRPEVIESQFYMWRLTKDPVYRERGWKFVQTATGGYHGLLDVNRVVNGKSPAEDKQESFFLAETLKYLYLLFSEDELLPLDKYVLNTEAQPLAVRGYGRRSQLVWGDEVRG
ncbi:hypothetical protein HDU96_000857 [Phlyctochytrium bullatum]|nr:hypothetical protein HDU96_000857 [Phlyctochytrium bullatum]